MPDECSALSAVECKLWNDVAMPKRTILVNHLLEPPNRITGITRYLFALLSELLKRQAFEYVLLTTWDREHLPAAIASTATILTHRYRNSTPLNLLNQMAIVPHMFHRTKAVLEFNCNPIGCFWPNWPRVITIHDLYFDVLPDKYRFRHRFWWRLFLPLSLASCTRAVCVSANTRDDLRRFYPKFGGKATVIHEACIPLAHNDFRDSEPPRLEGPYGLFVGNVSPNKAPDVLAAGLALLEAKGKPLTVYHVGRDDAGLLSQAVKRRQLSLPVRHLGQYSDKALAAAYAGATCVIITSTHEGFCLPVLEAQSFGTPLVCSDIPVLREVAGDGALYFRSGEAAELACCLENMFADPTVRGRMSLAAQRNTTRFSWANAAAEMEALFEESVRRHG
jgi:glycosyltransferase involved in cell wall biosynthesis